MTVHHHLQQPQDNPSARTTSLFCNGTAIAFQSPNREEPHGKPRNAMPTTCSSGTICATIHRDCRAFSVRFYLFTGRFALFRQLVWTTAGSPVYLYWYQYNHTQVFDRCIHFERFFSESVLKLIALVRTFSETRCNSSSNEHSRSSTEVPTILIYSHQMQWRTENQDKQKHHPTCVATVLLLLPSCLLHRLSISMRFS
jgi:hypothetical protein